MLRLGTASGAILGLQSTVALALHNPYALHRHGPSGVLAVLSAGDRAATAGGVQLLVEAADGSVAAGAWVATPVGADPARAVDLGSTLLGVLCYSHDHVYVVDLAAMLTTRAAAPVTVAAWRLGASGFDVVSTAAAAMGPPRRSTAALHDVVPLGDGAL